MVALVVIAQHRLADFDVSKNEALGAFAQKLLAEGGVAANAGLDAWMVSLKSRVKGMSRCQLNGTVNGTLRVSPPQRSAGR
jgi:hypothetical protein